MNNKLNQKKTDIENVLTENTNKRCVCKGCGYEQNVTFGVPCSELICPNCEGILLDE